MRERFLRSWSAPSPIFSLVLFATSSMLMTMVLCACETGSRPTMNPGADCVGCHTTDTHSIIPSAVDNPGQRAPKLPWTAAGTVFKTPQGGAGQGVKDVHLLIRDALDAGVELVSNEVGNFYTAELLTPPLTVQITYAGKSIAMINMPTPQQEYGADTQTRGVGCNYCHHSFELFTDGGDPRNYPDGGGLPITEGFIYIPQ